ncbi:hypothetical protein ACFWNT_31170 [Streptomyces sp. NPDC058409]|uniref:hypothetical protein n=1 Tax=Streptomyces sp. NPDC058409 TaxID=3346484 RepID=UPI0036601972
MRAWTGASTAAGALRGSLPGAPRWPGVRAMTAGFAVRVDARRPGDAAACPDLIGLTDCAAY